MEFVAIDVETANADMGSICQIGIARFAEGRLVDEWSSLVDPEARFAEANIAIHGIEPDHVNGMPRLPDIADTLRSRLNGKICVSHMPFDRSALAKAFRRYDLPPLAPSWLDSAAVVRRTWADLSQKGYGLKSVCQRIGYEFRHHDALEDAKAAGYVLLAAMREARCDLKSMLVRVTQPVDPTRPAWGSWGPSVTRVGNPEGPLHGEVVVFTGALQMPRQEAADLAAHLGCEVSASVSKKTTLLVVGDQDVSLLAGHEKSTKHRKAENLIMEGHPIRIIGESDFNALVEGAHAMGPANPGRS
jgi:DNA polymerase III subunit epsilon